MLSRYLSFAIVCFRKYSRVRRYLPFLYLSTLSISSSTRIYLIFHRFAIPSRGIMQPWFPRLQRVVPDHPCFWIPFCKNPFISPSIPPLSLSYTLKYFDLSALASSLLTFIRWSSFTFRCNCSLWFLQCRHLIPQYVLVLHPFLRFTWSLDLSSPPQVCILLTVTLFPLPSPLPKLPFCSMSLANATFQYLINSITLFSYTKSSNYKFTKFNLSTIQHTRGPLRWDRALALHHLSTPVSQTSTRSNYVTIRNHQPRRAKNNFLSWRASWLIVATGGEEGSMIGGAIEAGMVLP